MSSARHNLDGLVALLVGALCACGPTDGGGGGTVPATDAGAPAPESSSSATSMPAPSSSVEAQVSSLGVASSSAWSSSGGVVANGSASSTTVVSSSAAPSSSVETCIAQVVCPGNACGLVTGVCGVQVDCGGCAWPQVCGVDVPNRCGGAISTLMFQESARVTVGQDPRSMALMEKDAQQGTTLMTANTGSQELRAVVVAADGSASAGVTRELPGLPVAVVASNVVGSGARDAVTVAWSAGALVLWDAPLATGGHVMDPVVVAAGPRGVAVADLDGNGTQDAAVVHDNGTLLVVWDLGAQGQHSQVLMQEPGRLSSVAVGDVTGDGLPDVVVTSADFDAVLVVPGVAGGLGAPVRYPSLYAPGAVTLADVDGDGRLDVVVVHASSGVVALYPSSPAGLGAAQVMVDAGEPTAVAFADVDGDGAVDAVVAGADGFVSVRAPAMVPVRTVRVWAGSAPVAVVVEDVNLDGAPDVAVLNQVGGDVVVLLNQSF